MTEAERTPTENELHQLCETQKKQLEQAGQQIQGGGAQINAMKQMLGEQLDTVMILRTNLGLMQQAHNAVSQQWENTKLQLVEADKKIAAYLSEIYQLKADLEVARAGVATLTQQIEEPELFEDKQEVEDHGIPDVA